MDAHLPPEVAAGLRRAAKKRASKENAGFSVESDGVRHRVLRLRRHGFDLKDEGDTHLRGYVDLYKGSVRVARCLIIAARQMEGEVRYEIKMRSPAANGAPLDYERTTPEIAGLLPGS